MEQESSHLIQAGYLKGAQQAGVSLFFMTTARPASGKSDNKSRHNYSLLFIAGDFMISTGEIRISYENPDPEVVAVNFHVDNVAQEGNETFTMELMPSSTTTVPTGESIYFLKTIDMTIIDSDGRHTCNE